MHGSGCALSFTVEPVLCGKWCYLFNCYLRFFVNRSSCYIITQQQLQLAAYVIPKVASTYSRSSTILFSPSISGLDSNVFWIFVVTMLLITKLPLVVTKPLVFFSAPKSINSLLHLMFFWTVHVSNFLTRKNTLLCWYMPHWWMMMIFREKWNHYTLQQKTPRQAGLVLSCSKKKQTLFRVYCMPLYACQLWGKTHRLDEALTRCIQ